MGNATGPDTFLTQIQQNKAELPLTSVETEESRPDEDEDFNIYFEDRKSLLDHLSHLEEDNLFKIHLVQEDEQALEKEKKISEATIK